VKTCTVVISHSHGVCGQPAVVVVGEFAECAEHAADAVSIAKTSGPVVTGPSVGDAVDVARHGKVYRGTVTRVTRGGRVFAQVTYGNGASREVEVGA
jgi:uncharacterized protein (DUF1684 family)